jgi:proline iminopeptidase
VERLALVSPAPAWRAARDEFERRFQARAQAPGLVAAREALRASGLREADPGAYQRRAFELSVAGYFHDPARAAEMTPFRVTGRTQQEVWASLGEYDLRPRLPSLAVPALVLHGDDDPIPLDTARTVAELLRAAFRVVPDCGHAPHVEAPDALEAVAAFLG